MKDAVKKILIVDDEPKIIEVLKSYLENSGYLVKGAVNGHQAVELFDGFNPSLVILDLMLPDITGEEICRTLRRKSSIPIIMLTAKIEEEDILKGLDVGADDYITKPFSPKQVVARVAALLRRAAGIYTPSSLLVFNEGDLVVDVEKYDVTKAGQILSLTPTEFRLLLTMVRHPARVFTREELISAVSSDMIDIYDRTIDSHIKNLRQKIENDSKSPEYILTVHGIGYKFGGEPS